MQAIWPATFGPGHTSAALPLASSQRLPMFRTVPAPHATLHILSPPPCWLLLFAFSGALPTSLSFPLIFPGLLWAHLVCDFDTTLCTILCAPSSTLNCYLFCRWSHYTYSIIGGRFFFLRIQIFISLPPSCHFLKDRNDMDKWRKIRTCGYVPTVNECMAWPFEYGL